MCVECNRYTTVDPQTGEPDYRLEDDFARIEGDAVEPLNKLVQDQVSLTWDDVFSLSCYVAFLISRSPSWVESTKQHHVWSGEQLKAVCLEGDRKDVLAFFSNQEIDLKLRPEFGLTTMEDVADAVIDLVRRGRMSLSEEEMGKNYWLNRTIGFGNKLVWLVYSQNYWQIGKPVREDKYFLTSDNPVVMLDPWAVGKEPSRNIGAVHAILCLPLTPKRVLFIHGYPLVHLELLSNMFVDHLNYLQMFHAYKQVVSYCEEAWVQETLDGIPDGAGQTGL
jgi:hypothetical protein